MMKYHQHYSSAKIFLISLMFIFSYAPVKANEDLLNQDIEKSILIRYQNILIESFNYYRKKLDFNESVIISRPRNFPVLIDNNNIAGISQENFQTELFFSRLYKTVNKLPVKIKQNIIRISHIPVNEGYLSSRFGFRKDPIHGLRRMHKGIDIAAKYGSKVNPLGKGTVVFAGHKSGYGNTVEIKHGKTVLSRYTHLKKFLVNTGQFVNVKDKIGLIGNSGRSTGPHLHLEVLINDQQVDPQIFLANHFGSRSGSYQVAKAKIKQKAIKKETNNKITSNRITSKKVQEVKDFPQVSYQDYVESMDGVFGFSAPNASFSQ